MQPVAQLAADFAAQLTAQPAARLDAQLDAQVEVLLAVQQLDAQRKGQRVARLAVQLAATAGLSLLQKDTETKLPFEMRPAVQPAMLRAIIGQETGMRATQKGFAPMQAVLPDLHLGVHPAEQ